MAIERSKQLPFVILRQQLIAKVLFVVSDPGGSNAAPDSDFVLRRSVSQKTDLELLQRGVQIRANHIIDGPNVFEQFGRQGLVANRRRAESSGISWFWIGHELIIPRGQTIR